MRASGFTLLELLVAISIFSILGLGSYQLLHSVSESHAKVREIINSYNGVNHALNVMQRDFNQFLARSVRDEYGEPLSPIIFEGENYPVEFTRGGWSNPGGRSRSELQRVAYSIDYEEEVLKRHFWLVLDRAEDSEPVVQTLLEGLTEFHVTGLLDNDKEEFDLASQNIEEAMPIAVEVVIVSEDFGDVRRIFQLVDPYRPSGNGIAGEGIEQKPESDKSDGPVNEPDQEAPTVRPGVNQ